MHWNIYIVYHMENAHLLLSTCPNHMGKVYSLPLSTSIRFTSLPSTSQLLKWELHSLEPSNIFIIMFYSYFLSDTLKFQLDYNLNEGRNNIVVLIPYNTKPQLCPVLLHTTGMLWGDPEATHDSKVIEPSTSISLAALIKCKARSLGTRSPLTSLHFHIAKKLKAHIPGNLSWDLFTCRYQKANTPMAQEYPFQ